MRSRWIKRKTSSTAKRIRETNCLKSYAAAKRQPPRLKKIGEAKQRVEQRQAEADRKRGRKPGDGRKNPRGGRPFKRSSQFGVPEEKAQDNFTDPESRIMKSSGGFEQCYNTQAAVDEETQMIVATGVTNNAADNRQLLGMIDAVQENLEHPPEQVVADAGYKSELLGRLLPLLTFGEL